MGGADAMSAAPSMPIYWDAYLADTTHLTTEEHGAYLLLLAAMWRRGGSVPDDDKDNARILGLSAAKWRRIKARLSADPVALIFENDTISQKKMLKTWQITQEKIENNSSNGAKGGRPKSKGNNDLAKANGSLRVNPDDNPNATIPEPEPEPEVKKKAKALQKNGTRLALDWTLPKDWGDWALLEGWSESAVRDQADTFKDYWNSKAGSGSTKLDWQATWRNWMRNSKQPKHINGGQHEQPTKSQQRIDAFIKGAVGSP